MNANISATIRVKSATIRVKNFLKLLRTALILLEKLGDAA
jgi:hypothetical protein